MKTISKLNNFISVLIFLLIATGYFRFISTALGTPNYFTQAFLVSVIFYLCLFRISRHELAFFVYNRAFFLYAIAFIVYPLVVNFVGLLIFDASIFAFLSWCLKIFWFNLFGFFVFRYRKTIFSLKVFYLFLLLVTLSFTLNTTSVALFMDIGKKYGVSLSYAEWGDLGGRFMGFYLHPNAAAMSILIVYFSYFVTRATKPICTLSVIILISLTGSRSALVIFSLLLLANYYFHVKHGYIIFSFIRTYNQLISIVLVSLFIIIATYFFTLYANADFVERLMKMASFTNDTSARIRLIAQFQYVRMFLDNPIIGIGFEKVRLTVDNGILIKSSHNMYLERALQYGILGVLSYTAVYFYMLTNISSSKFRFKIVILLLLLYGLFVNTLDLTPVFYSLIAILITFYKEKTK